MKITDKQRLNWLQNIGAISWSYEELNEGVFPDVWGNDVVRVAIDAAIRAEKKR